jgi:hypothetical protein
MSTSRKAGPYFFELKKAPRVSSKCLILLGTFLVGSTTINSRYEIGREPDAWPIDVAKHL